MHFLVGSMEAGKFYKVSGNFHYFRGHFQHFHERFYNVMGNSITSVEASDNCYGGSDISFQASIEGFIYLQEEIRNEKYLYIP